MGLVRNAFGGDSVEKILLVWEMSGGNAWRAPLMTMVAERRGHSWRTTLRMASPVCT
jgi:hypothetical protein